MPKVSSVVVASYIECSHLQDKSYLYDIVETLLIKECGSNVSKYKDTC